MTWGTNPGQVCGINDRVPDPADFADPTEQKSTTQRLSYMGLNAKTPIHDIAIDRVFIGSCTNARIEDLRAAATVVKGHRVSSDVSAMVVPGSGQVKAQAEQEGLDQVFKEAGFDWREAGMQHVPGNEPRQACRPASVVPAPAIATLKDDRARGAARTWLAPRWPPRRPSKDTSSTFASGTTRTSCFAFPEGPAAPQHANPNRHQHPFHSIVDTAMQSFTIHTGVVATLGSCQRRHRSDHPEAISQTN